MNENHQRVLTVYLCAIEKSISNIQRELNSSEDGQCHILCSIEDKVGERTKAQLIDGSSKMLDEIDKIKRECGLSAQTESSANRIKAQMTEIWSTINDLRPKILENYGSLTEEDKKMFDSLVLTLLSVLDEMNHSFDLMNDQVKQIKNV